MKKRQALIAAASVAFHLTACKKTDQPYKSSIIGKWDITKVHIIRVSNNTTKDTILTGYPAADNLQFKNQTDAVISRSGYSPEGGMNTPLYIGLYPCTYQISGNKLTFISSGVPGKPERIIELDRKTLILHTEDTNDSGKITADTYYTKE